MAHGLEWIETGSQDSGMVLVLQDDGTTKMLKAVDYVVSGLKPPIYELPFRSLTCVRIDVAQSGA